jgi:hypothetical protein
MFEAGYWLSVFGAPDELAFRRQRAQKSRMTAFTLSLDIVAPGWMRLRLQDDSFCYEPDWASCVSGTDVVVELVRVSTKLLNGVHVAEIQLEHEPATTNLRFSPETRAASAEMTLLSAVENQGTTAETTVYSWAVSRKDFAQAVLRAMKALLERHGIEGFREAWMGTDYPRGAVAELEASLQAS